MLLSSLFSYTNLQILLKLLRSGVDLLAVWIILYYLIMTFRTNIRTMQLFKGVILILIIKGITTIFGLATLNALVDMVLTWGVLAVIIIFQPEIRHILEKMGQTRNDFTHELSSTEKETVMNELVNAITRMSKDHTGALITFERQADLSDFIQTGIRVTSDIKSELLLTIFYEGTPLHDGATIIKNDQIVASACFYPPTNKDVPANYGARHRAAIGISEITDSLTVVVSEETGNISFCIDGELKVINPNELRSQLIKELNWYGNQEDDHHE
ncbi:diadenylate cyclase CdaA [Eggerthia catenaformis]|uniref:diadenylate cyclase CdaA n=1 Tax=Eggerthia catenaformis TaxID=31973 RepID=UPI00248D77EA|nr:diadenylate cyclase CdaA [Eggerthia catenaformis]